MYSGKVANKWQNSVYVSCLGEFMRMLGSEEEEEEKGEEADDGPQGLCSPDSKLLFPLEEGDP